jgi:hypothetical protein
MATTQTIYGYYFILWGITTIAVDLNSIRVCRLDPKHTQQYDNKGSSFIGEHHRFFLKAFLNTGAQEV